MTYIWNKKKNTPEIQLGNSFEVEKLQKIEEEMQQLNKTFEEGPKNKEDILEYTKRLSELKKESPLLDLWYWKKSYIIVLICLLVMSFTEKGQQLFFNLFS